MTPIAGQLSFEGREVSASKLNIPGGIGEVDFVADNVKLLPGDELEMTIRFVVGDVHHPEKYDRDGVGAEPMKRVHDLWMLRRGWQITEITRQAEKEAAWLAAKKKGA